MQTQKRLIVVLGDQLSDRIAALRTGNRDRDVVFMAEVREEATYVPHHKKKIAFVFAAMRHFAEVLTSDGWTVDHVLYDTTDNAGSLVGEIERACRTHNCTEVLITEPGEWRLLAAFTTFAEGSPVPVRLLEDDSFLCSKKRFAAWANGRKQLRMEYFYREMRRETGLLMDGDKPEGGRWNFDAENRKPPKEGLKAPTPHRVAPDTLTQEVLSLVEESFNENFGTLKPFWFAVTKADAEQALDHFVQHALPRFGDYQDAMVADEPFLFHAVIALYLNTRLLDPLDVCRKVEQAYREGTVPLNAAEGFIRQIIGWREYVRGLYWLHMPDYGASNYFNNTRPLPAFYWTGETDMACLRACVTQTRDHAYAHHIQRLMVTGNFAMLTGIDPHAVHEWYLAVYADAFEWVEMPNTIGMSQFADGGLLASKPYAASGNYINRMSNYCGSCRYKVRDKTGPDACPFNYLYWDFLDRNRDKLSGNPRLAQVFRTWDKMDTPKQDDIRKDAAVFLKDL